MSERQRKAFVLERGKFSVEPVRRYAEPVFLWDAGEHRSSIWSELYPREALEALTRHDFDPATDFFVVAGGMTPVIRALDAMFRAYGQVNTLHWVAPDRMYTPILLGEPKEVAHAR